MNQAAAADVKDSTDFVPHFCNPRAATDNIFSATAKTHRVPHAYTSRSTLFNRKYNNQVQIGQGNPIVQYACGGTLRSCYVSKEMIRGHVMSARK